MTLDTRKARWLAAAATAAPVLALCLPFLLSSRCLFGIDFRNYHRAHFEMVREEVAREGRLPQWNPRQYAGTPLLGNPQAPYGYPPNLLFLTLPAEEAFELFVLLHLLAAAGGMYRLARRFRLGRPAAAIAGIAFGASLTLVARIHAGHLPYLITPCLAPAFLSLLVAALDRPTRLHAAALAGGTGVLLVGGTPQFLYHLALVAPGLALARTRRGPALGAAAGALGLGILIAGYHLWPAIEVAREATRGVSDDFYARNLMPAWHVLVPTDLLSLVTPAFPRRQPGADGFDLSFWHEKTLYFGFLPLLLAVLGAVRGRRTALFFAIAAAAALLAGMARHVPLHGLLSYLPGYGAFRLPARSGWVAVLCLSLLAGFGWNSLRLREPRRVLLTAAAWAIVGLDLVIHGLLRLETVPREAYAAPPWYARRIGPERADYRLLDLTAVRADAVAHGFRLLRGAGYPQPESLTRFYARAWRGYVDSPESIQYGSSLADPSILRRLNVRWYLTEGPPDPMPEGWREIDRRDGSILYEDALAPPPSVTRPSLDRIELRGTREVSETWMPGWTASADGGPVPVRRSEDGFIRVEAPAGPAVVHLVYAQPGARGGQLLTLLALAATAFLAGSVRRRGY